MDTMSAFAMGFANRDKPSRVFDWDVAARIIVSRGVEHASAGLGRDREHTGGKILQDGKPVPRDDTYTYLSSSWAIPQLRIDDDGYEGEIIDCWKWVKDTPSWGSDTYWPESALEILRNI